MGISKIVKPKGEKIKFHILMRLQFSWWRAMMVQMDKKTPHAKRLKSHCKHMINHKQIGKFTIQKYNI
jgi:hypothetical protein